MISCSLAMYLDGNQGVVELQGCTEISNLVENDCVIVRDEYSGNVKGWIYKKPLNALEKSSF